MSRSIVLRLSLKDQRKLKYSNSRIRYDLDILMGRDFDIEDLDGEGQLAVIKKVSDDFLIPSRILNLERYEVKRGQLVDIRIIPRDE